MVDALLILPIIAIFRAVSATSSYNILIVIVVVAVSDIVILSRYAASLFLVNSLECLEALQPADNININGFPQQSM